MLITLAGAGTADTGSVSGVVNTSLLIGLALFAVALPACFLLLRATAPAPVAAQPDSPAATNR